MSCHSCMSGGSGFEHFFEDPKKQQEIKEEFFGGKGKGQQKNKDCFYDAQGSFICGSTKKGHQVAASSAGKGNVVGQNLKSNGSEFMPW